MEITKLNKENFEIEALQSDKTVLDATGEVETQGVSTDAQGNRYISTGDDVVIIPKASRSEDKDVILHLSCLKEFQVISSKQLDIHFCTSGID